MGPGADHHAFAECQRDAIDPSRSGCGRGLADGCRPDILVDAVTMPVLPAASLGGDVGVGMGDDVAAILLTLAAENAELRQQLATAQDMLMETAIDAGNLYARIEAVQAERDAGRDEAERLQVRPAQMA